MSTRYLWSISRLPTKKRIHLNPVGCRTAEDCPPGFTCDEITDSCIELPSCLDDSHCMEGPCDTEKFPYTTCSYCQEGTCQPGCQSQESCPYGYICNHHECSAVAGKELLRSINIRTRDGCSICVPEGVSVHLLGEKNALFVDGTPCKTRTLDHAVGMDYGGDFGSYTVFDGTLNGVSDQDEKNMMESCYKVKLQKIRFTPHFQAPLNAQLVGGNMTWVGGRHDWNPLDVCVDWNSNNFAWLCNIYPTGPSTWNFTDCHDLLPYESCEDFYDSK